MITRRLIPMGLALLCATIGFALSPMAAQAGPGKDKLVVASDVAGTGSGKVECEVNGAGKFESCAAEYPEKTDLVVKASPQPGSAFQEWSAATGSASACSGSKSGSCSFTIEAESSLIAKFVLEYGFTPSTAGAGSGKVECEVNASTHFETCAGKYAEGTKLTLRGLANSGSVFSGFSGGTGSASSCSGTSNCTFVVKATSTVTATFIPEFTLTLTPAGGGTGKVECEVNASTHFETCAGKYAEGTKLTLKGVANAGSVFTGFGSGSGSASACTGTPNCTFTIAANSGLTPTFKAEEALTFVPKGGGSGQAECEVNASHVFATCASKYVEGTKLVLKATANPGSLFEGWSGGTGSAAGCTGTGTCSFTITTASTVEDTFKLLYKLSAEETGEGSGEVKCEVNGQGGFGTCAAEYPEGTGLVLEATPAPGSNFEGWMAGAGSAALCSGTGVCTFTIEAESSVDAQFGINYDTFGASTTGSGTGTVECDANGGGFGACASTYPELTELVVKETPNADSDFAGWSGTGSAGACSGSKEATCEFTVTEDSSVSAAFNPTYVLTVYKSGKGTVTSAPTGIDCGGTCTARFEVGKVALTATPEAGYEFAGWIGCDGAEPTCEVEIEETGTHVTAIFLKSAKEGAEGKEGKEGAKGTEGKEGKEGAKGTEGKEGAKGTEGKEGPEGTEGKEGAQGTEGKEGKEGAPGGPEGKEGKEGSAGAAGKEGPAGKEGAVGPGGPAGLPGASGTPGKIELVTCKTVKKNGKSVRDCTTKLVSGTASFTTAGTFRHATLSRKGVVYAAGVARAAHGRMALRLAAVRRLRPGRYTLTLILGRGRHETRQTEPFTLR